MESQNIHPDKKIQYTIDLTRGYHNLLQKEEDEKTQSYLWDGNVAGMLENGQESYYLQDEMGSPLRLMDKDGDLKDSYGYDEFGQDLYGNQGVVQPFGYTGYQPDRIAETYYAQAREYRPELGRFAAVDPLKGFTVAPYTLNEYGYCWNNPKKFVDLNGREPGEWTPGEETDYVGVYYLNSEDGAYTFGHSALLFVREDGSGTFYSFAASRSEAVNIVLGNDVPGYLSKANLSSEEVAIFMAMYTPYKRNPKSLVPGKGQVKTDGIDDDFLDGAKTPYTRYIYIPVTLQEGKVMSYYAEHLRDENGEGVYNLYARNCGMVAQDILRMGGKDFAAGSGMGKNIDEKAALVQIYSSFQRFEFGSIIEILINALIKDYMDQTMPNAAYHKGEFEAEWLMAFAGWKTGKICQRKRCLDEESSRLDRKNVNDH